MAATAYAALVSLMNTMDQIRVHPFLSTCFDNSHFASLREKVDLLLDFVENHSDAIIPEEDDMVVDAVSSDLLSRIAAAAQKAEDIIEVEAIDRICRSSTEENRSYSHDLPEMIHTMGCIKDEVMKVTKEGRVSKDEQHIPKTSMLPPSSSSSSSASSSSAAGKASKMVGFDKYLNQLRHRLIGDKRSGLLTIPIVGMGGIGKTTLARNAYDDSYILYHFDVRAWVVVSQQFTRKKILLQALSSLSREGSNSTWENDATYGELGEELHKILFDRRYLIVLDDVWSVEAWEGIKLFFPDNRNGSRIIVTTRQPDVVHHLGSSSSSSSSSSPVVEIEFLDEEKSWELFCDKAFARKDCPPELQGAGKEIVEKCEGLPLAITVIGGLLGKSPMTPEHWEKIARDKSQILEDSGEGNKILSILYLSYKHLPVYLKSCFLFMGLFPEYHKINKPQLIQLWIAQGFIKPKKNHSMEEIGESYVNELVDRNILLVRDYIISDRYSICYLHDVVRELCLRVAEKEDFYCVQRLIGGSAYFIADKRNASRFPFKESLDAYESPSLMKPLAYNSQTQGEFEAPFKSRLLRVLCTGGIRFLDVSPLIFNLRSFMVVDDDDDDDSHSSSSDATFYSIPSEISLCWSLQALVLYAQSPVVAPPNIWRIPQLRHIDVRPAIYLHDPPQDYPIVLQNLHTLKSVKNLNLNQEVCERMPNIKELEIGYDFEEEGGATWYSNLQNLERFNKLEILRYFCTGTECLGDDKLQRLKLPTSLKELTLSGCRLQGSDMAILASLPRLQILNLHGITLMEEWNFDHEKGFSCLEHLEIIECDDLREWSENNSCFPMLKTLHLQILPKLERIPSYIGNIPSLITIILFNCGESAIRSALEILKEQENYGNEQLNVELIFFDEYAAEAEKWRKFKYPKLRISSWSSDTISSDEEAEPEGGAKVEELGIAERRERRQIKKPRRYA